ncbi:hypothetical protein FJR48_05280 [Sulfurimonas lithotrophica]|uniref:Uncharacterized protein n=1 Tax=Sulfurimonas lithotrophica TaxID=2590022 RepID=A0A5P8P0Q8_9BACT|nr:hypothetical protein [Sulfurimonas lithotrophica]QFR49167.1 hypothetical protein FJR48_05280 [Sulfurimonas lithotrophica]
MDKEKIVIPRGSLDFYKYEKDGLIYYEFNATRCSPPEPMVNAIAGLSMLKEKNERLVGFFFHVPSPLFGRIGNEFVYEIDEMDNGDVRVEFQLA